MIIHKPFIVAYFVWFVAALVGRIVVNWIIRSLASIIGSTIVLRIALWSGWAAMLAISYFAFRYVIINLVLPHFVRTDHMGAEHQPGACRSRGKA